ncbi:hypothetical protein A2610_01410 [Candidatus Wolfebacteria bacterium RIFOXYD1_FULL_48_65]|uniref:Major facilitator superfamily (MFS) profile domain-containing protein n=1 Tax=Candidatus Wolfebacteria bacterium RIFOXYD1_FULL_48_65 TaxID=1802561 RepID=A0A1F8E1J9_9BACT|nr:MAG: hypothetical protein A2610_01410 [Candidatus Wolfebacteria bacterium RIFOXYD1_FULL_48_65]
MINDKHHLHLFANTEMNALYITLGFLAFAEGLISVFVPIFFWNLGFPMWKILLFYFLHSALFLLFALTLLPVIKKLSDKMMMFLSIPFLVCYFFGLGMMKTIPILFFVLPIASALHGLLFNIGYHIDFSSIANKKKIGEEVGARFVLGSVLALAAPFFGGVLIEAAGFQNTFFIGSTILIASVLPLFFFPRRNPSPNLTVRSIIPFFKESELRPFTLSGIGYAIEAVFGRAIWPLFVFLIIGDIKQFGGVISIGLIVTALVTYLVGYLSDYGKRRDVITLTSIGNALVWLIRPFIAQATSVVGLHIGGNAVNSGLMVAWTSQYYKITKTVPDATAFIISRELLYNAARVMIIPILMLIAYYLPTRSFFSVGFVVAACASLLFLAANKTHTHLLIEPTKLTHDHDTSTVA